MAYNKDGSEGPTVPPGVPSRRAAALAFARRGARVSIGAVLYLQRFLFGVMFTMSGTSWFRRDDAAGYLRETLASALATVHADGSLYGAFLANLVIEHTALFAVLVGAGEFLVGVALLTGFPPRAGGFGGMFLTVNYGLAFQRTGGLLPPGGNYLLALMMTPLATHLPYRRFALRGATLRRIASGQRRQTAGRWGQESSADGERGRRPASGEHGDQPDPVRRDSGISSS